jgi:hypothetical protein
MWEAIDDTLRKRRALGRTEFSQCPSPGGVAVAAGIPMPFCRKYARGVRSLELVSRRSSAQQYAPIRWERVWPAYDLGRTAGYGVPLLAGREWLLLAARHRRWTDPLGIASSPPSGVCKRTPRIGAVFTCRVIGQLAGSQGRGRKRNLRGERDPAERCLSLFDRGSKNLF